MSEPEQYRDAVLARRFREWVDEAAPAAAPERLVYAVMDTVELLGRPRPRLVAMRLESLLQWVALTLVIAIGVTVGSILSRPNQNVSSSPSPSASASPSGSTARAPSSPRPSPVGAVPSLATISDVAFSRPPGPSAIRGTATSIWVGTPAGEVVELDPTTGVEGSRTLVGDVPITINPIGDLLWIGSGGRDLPWLDPATHETGLVRGAGGHVVLEAAGSLWISSQERFIRLDAASRTVMGSIAVPGHRASDVAAIVGDELWTGTGSSIVRLALPSGAMLGAVDGQPSGIVATDRGVFTVDRGRLLRLAGPAGIGPLASPIPLLDGLPQSYGEAVDGDRLWVAGPIEGGGGSVVGIDLATMSVTSRTPIAGGAGALAFAGGSLWVGGGGGALVRLAVP